MLKRVTILAAITLAILTYVLLLYVNPESHIVPVVPLSQEQSALDALGEVAQSEADAIVASKLAVVTTLAQQASNDPSLMRSAGWRLQWQNAWYTISLNTSLSLSAAASQCAAAAIIGTALDLRTCTEQASKALTIYEVQQ